MSCNILLPAADEFGSTQTEEIINILIALLILDL